MTSSTSSTSDGILQRRRLMMAARRGSNKKGTVLNLSFYFVITVLGFAAFNTYLNAKSGISFLGTTSSGTNSNSGGQQNSILDTILQEFSSYSSSNNASPAATNSDRGDGKNGDGGINFRLAGLSCERYGGPSDEIAKEMVYWEDIPSDRCVKPLMKGWMDGYQDCFAYCMLLLFACNSLLIFSLY
jgi:hypothetical protein